MEVAQLHHKRRPMPVPAVTSSRRESGGETPRKPRRRFYSAFRDCVVRAGLTNTTRAINVMPAA